jgi:sulfur-oxidizing protein SoxY
MTSVPDSRQITRPSRRVGRDGCRALCALLLLGPVVAWAQNEAEERWAEIKASLFPDRPIRDGAGLIALDTPYRALDAAVVPVSITREAGAGRERHIRRLHLVIDMNPSPVAAVFRFPGPHDWGTLSTRVRVNAYTHVRAVAELADGELYMVANYVKASGGCSAPATKDPAAAAAQLGRMRLLLPERLAAGDPVLAQLLIKHPNSSGLQFDQVSRQYIPADFVRRIEVRYRGEPLFTVDADISLSEDPSIRFGFVPDAPGALEVSVRDSAGRAFEHRVDLPVEGPG